MSNLVSKLADTSLRAATALRELPLRASVALGAGGFGETAKPGRLWKAMLLVLPLAAAIYTVMPRYVLVATPSIHAHVVTAIGGEIRKGDLVQFMLSHRLAGPKPISVTKYVLCTPGEALSSRVIPAPLVPGKTTTLFYCGGVLLNATKPFTRGGEPTTAFAWPGGVIPPGYVYVGSEHVDGFDSRYYGLVAVARLQRMGKVL